MKLDEALEKNKIEVWDLMTVEYVPSGHVLCAGSKPVDGLISQRVGVREIGELLSRTNVKVKDVYSFHLTEHT